jgi:cyclophilin family peptidyl-prolyl cis-trans isomerase
MCKPKPIYSTYFLHIISAFLLYLLLLSACSLPKVIPVNYSDQVKAVHEAAAQRDGNRLLALTNSADTLAVQAAWRALASTPSVATDSLLQRALRSGHPLAWFALSTRSLSPDQLRVLESKVIEAGYPEQLIRTLGLQGDVQTASLLDMWVSSIEPGSEREPAFALALSRIQLRGITDSPQTLRLISRAAITPQPIAARNWLYALYRSTTLTLSVEQADQLVADLDSFKTLSDPDVRRTVARILAKAGRKEALSLYPPEQIPSLQVNAAVDLVRMLPYFTANLPVEQVNALFTHPDPVVLATLLDLLADDAYTPAPSWVQAIEGLILQHRERDPRLYLQAVWTRMRMPALPANAATSFSPDTAYIKQLALRDPYYAEKGLRILGYRQPVEKWPALLRPFLSSDQHLQRFFASNLLSAWIRAEKTLTSSQRDLLRSMLWESLEKPNRSVMATLAPLLLDEPLTQPGDAEMMLKQLKAYSLPEDIEVYQMVLPGLFAQLNDKGNALADSLAGYKVSALNGMLKEYVSEALKPQLSATAAVNLLSPDWALLRKLGSQPRLQLETELGLIIIALDPLRAPSTVSAIAKLAEAGEYNGVAFHRVVPNFVIQGGDIEFGDGYGGPDFVLPNEPSERGFVRGAVGIASAGKDTEGSQYFMMIDDAPHLDGNYTLFGYVEYGLDVVQRIRVGDRVIRARVTNY